MCLAQQLYDSTVGDAPFIYSFRKLALLVFLGLLKKIYIFKNLFDALNSRVIPSPNGEDGSLLHCIRALPWQRAVPP